jgi:hypothetical protein
MDSLIFLGRSLDADNEGKLYFQDVNSYGTGVPYDPADKDTLASFLITTENELGNLFEFEQALDEMMRCSLRRGSR